MSFSLEDKIRVKELGRPTPTLKITQDEKSKSSTYKRQFHVKTYEENKWICGCEITNALFCFPCLLFGGENSWSKLGVTDLGHLSNLIKRHSQNKTHLINVLNLANIGKVNIATQLDSAYRMSI